MAPLSRFRTLTCIPIRSFDASTTLRGSRRANELPQAAIFIFIPFVNDSQNDYRLKLAIHVRRRVDDEPEGDGKAPSGNYRAGKLGSQRYSLRTDVS